MYFAKPETLESRMKYVGSTYGSLTILEVFRGVKETYVSKDPVILARCRCKCGKETISPLAHILSGRKVSCGCVQRSQRMINLIEDRKLRLFNRKCNNYIINPDGSVYVQSSNRQDTWFIVDLYTWVWLSMFVWAVDSKGYMSTKVMGLHFRYHKILYPEASGCGYVIDHKNRSRLDNRYENLRVTDNISNSRNRGMVKENVGYRGVTRTKNGTFKASITIDHKKRTKVFSTIDEAIQQRIEWEGMYYNIIEINLPRLFMPNGTIDIYGFPFHLCDAKYCTLFALFGIRMIPYPTIYSNYMNMASEMYPKLEGQIPLVFQPQNNPAPAAQPQPQQQQAVPNQVQQ